MVIHCIKCGVVRLTNSKRQILDYEYNGFQWHMIFGTEVDILTQYKRAKGHYYKKDKIKYKNYPIILPHQSIRFRKKETQLTPYWIKIGVRKKKGVGIWLPLKPHKELPDFKYLRDSLLLKDKKNEYVINLIFDIPRETIKPENILAIDLGERIMATVCTNNGIKRFYGRDVRSIRRHYAWLRKRLGNKKLLKNIKRIGNKEKNIVRNKLHHISKDIVKLAEETNSLIIIGDITGIRKKKRSKRLNRIIFQMPYYELTRMITYKAQQRGIIVRPISEYNGSITCHKCGNIDKTQRKSQGLFLCSHCGLQYNADLNGAMNNLNRAKEQDFLAGAIGEAHKSLTEEIIGKSVCN